MWRAAPALVETPHHVHLIPPTGMITRLLTLHEYYTVTVMRSRSNEYDGIRVRIPWRALETSEKARRKAGVIAPAFSLRLCSFCYDALSLLSNRSIRLWRFLLAFS